MNKPLSLMAQETEQEIVEIINKSQLPAYVLKKMLQEIYSEVERIESEEIKKYNEEQDKKVKKEGEK